MLEEKDFKKIKKVVGGAIKGETDSLRQEFKSDFESGFNSFRKEVKSDIEISANSLRREFKKEFKSVRSDISKIRRDINLVIGTFDRHYLELRRRVSRIEEFLKLEPLEELI